MKAAKKIPIIISLCMIITVLFSSTVFAYEGVTFNEKEYGNAQTISGKITSSGVTTSWDYPYSDNFFTLPSDEYNHTFAKSSLGLALAAFRDKNNESAQDDNLISYFEDAGFEDISTDTYKTEPTTDSIAYGIARKTVNGCTVIAVSVCGGNYTKEWAGNFTIGDATRSQGFNEAAQKVEAGLNEYIEKQNITGKIKVWITGYSRGAAVSNITAADLTDSKKFEDVYAYCIATPRTTKEPGNYTNIFNIIGKDDVITKIPFADWGFKRYGVDLYTKSIETDFDSMAIIERSNEVYTELTGSNMTVNPEVSSQLRVIFDYLCMIIPDTKTYAEDFQPLLLESLESGEATIGIYGLIDVLNKFAEKSETDQTELQEMIDYLQRLANVYVLNGNKAQKESGAWDVELGMKNLFSEHVPYKYIARMFSFDNPELIYSSSTSYTQLTLYGGVNMQIMSDGKLIESVKSDGTIQNYYADKYYNMPDVRTNDKTNAISRQFILTLPADVDWDIYISSDISLSFGYIASSLSAETVHAQFSDYYSIDMRKNQLYKILIRDGIIATDDESAEYTSSTNMEMNGTNYSPSFSMMLSTPTKNYLTIQQVLGLAMIVLLFIAFELLLSVIFAIIRKIRKKKRHGIVTWIWTLVNVALFAFLEIEIWYYVPAYPIAKAALKLIALLLIIGVLLKGWKKYKNTRNAILVPCLIAVAAADFALEWLFIGERNSWNWIIPVVVYLLLMLCSWFVWHDKKDVRLAAKEAKMHRKARKKDRKIEEALEREMAEADECADDDAPN